MEVALVEMPYLKPLLDFFTTLGGEGALFYEQHLLTSLMYVSFACRKSLL